MLLSFLLSSERVQHTSGKVYHITPTQIPLSECPHKSCMTLSQFAQNSSGHIPTSSTILSITGENHILDVELAVSNIAEFVMQSPNSTFNQVITIKFGKFAKFKFTNVGCVRLKGLRLERCNNNMFELIHQLTIEYCTFIDSKSPATLVNSKANITGTSFSSNTGKFRNNSELLQRLLGNPGQAASLGGALVIMYSTVAIEKCDFRGNAASFGGAVFSEYSDVTISNTNFSDNHANDCINGHCAGGSLLTYGSERVFINNSTFFNNTANSDGGVVAAYNSTLVISNGNIFKNVASRNGGAVAALNSSSIKFISSTCLYDNQAHQDGGAVYLSDSNATFDKCDILSNEASGNGGAIQAQWSNLNISKSTLDSNKAEKCGGVLYGAKENYATFNNCSLYGNKATYGAAVRMNINSGLYIVGSQFTDNNASFDGGAVYVYNHSFVTIEHCDFTSNEAYDTGGAIYIEKSSMLNISFCNLNGNKAVNGGALDANAKSTAQVTSCNFRSNKATTGGAAIHMYVSSVVRIFSSTFEKNEADDAGAAVYGSRNCTVSISNSKLYNNSAKSLGGGVRVTRMSNVEINSCEFVRNSADFGGAVLVSINSNAAIMSSNFHQNSASIEGGVLHAYKYSLITVGSSNLTSNLARSGGACFALMFSELVFQNCIFLENRAQFGGAITLLEGNFVTLMSSSAIGNTAVQSGGVFYAQKSEIIAKMNSSFHHNMARLSGGVVYSTDESRIIISTISFLNNSADDGGVLSLLDKSIALIDQSNFTDNQATDTGGVIYLTHKALVSVSASKFDSSKANRRGGVVMASVMSEVCVTESTFSYNAATAGAALAIEESSTLSFASSCKKNHQFPSNDFEIFSGVSDSDNEILIFNNTALKKGGAIYLSESRIYFEMETNITSNEAGSFGGGIHAITSSFIVKSIVHFVQNKAKSSGGGVSLRHSKIYDNVTNEVGETHTVINFVSNQATSGGALYVDFDQDNDSILDVCSEEYSSSNGCFFQNVSDAFAITFDKNHASDKGDNLFGGLLDRCTIITNTNQSQFVRNGVARFNSISNHTNIETISSKPLQVCLCEDGSPKCHIKLKSAHVKHKDKLVLQLVAVDQVQNPVSTTIKTNVEGFKLSTDQASQPIDTACSELKYHITAPPRADPYDATIFADGPCKDIGISKLVINIRVVPCTCPPGFQVDVGNKTCACTCDQSLLHFIPNLECDLEQYSVKKDGVSWISVTDSNESEYRYLYFPYCPVSYCQSPSKSVHVNLSQVNGSDAQCSDNHSGLLCGKCRPHYSLSLEL